MNVSDYIAGNSFIHRLAPGFKIVLLIFISSLLFIVPNLILSGAIFLLVIVAYQIAGISFITLWRQLRPILWLLVIIFVAQLYITDWLVGIMVIVRLAALLLFASLVTLTTRMSDMLDALEKCLYWLKYIGISPAKVSLALSLALRFIPVLASITLEVREAQKVRGLDRSIIAIAVPLITRTLKMADDIGDAINARSYDSTAKK